MLRIALLIFQKVFRQLSAPEKDIIYRAITVYLPLCQGRYRIKV